MGHSPCGRLRRYTSVHCKTLQLAQRVPALAAPNSAGSTAPRIPAAKIQVLGLAAIKKRLGPKWDPLSGLIHRLFEKTIAQEQGPSDHFISLDELSYAVTFHDLSLNEANIACLAIAKKVCQLLFGEQGDEVSVRNIVGEIAGTALLDVSRLGSLIEASVENGGRQTVVTRSDESGNPAALIWVSEEPESFARSPIEHIRTAHALIDPLGLRLGFFPVWELERDQSNAVFLLPFRGSSNHVAITGQRTLVSLDRMLVSQIEIALLNAAAAYAQRLHGEQKICAVGVGVSYDSLASLGTRVRYLTALQKVVTSLSNPLWLRIENIPVGAPLMRVAELVAKLKVVRVRVSVEFEPIGSLPEMNVRLGVIGFGGIMTSGIDVIEGKMICEKLVRRAVAQRAFAFLDHLDSMEFVDIARKSHVRFGRGIALGMRHLSGLEKVPDFPLTRTDWG